ncbi:hypothetical protein D3C84_919640 [compost metagenome]
MLTDASVEAPAAPVMAPAVPVTVNASAEVNFSSAFTTTPPTSTVSDAPTVPEVALAIVSVPPAGPTALMPATPVAETDSLLVALLYSAE